MVLCLPIHYTSIVCYVALCQYFTHQLLVTRSFVCQYFTHQLHVMLVFVIFKSMLVTNGLCFKKYDFVVHCWVIDVNICCKMGLMFRKWPRFPHRILSPYSTYTINLYAILHYFKTSDIIAHVHVFLAFIFTSVLSKGFHNGS